MYCIKCGQKIDAEHKFCVHCGNQAVQESKVKEKSKLLETFWQIIGLLVTGLALIVGMVAGAVSGPVFFIFLAAYAIGSWFPKWYLKQNKNNPTVIKSIVWSNVATWILPPLGVMTGVAAFEFSKVSQIDQKKFKLIAIIGLTLSVINAIVGILIKLQGAY